MNSNQRINHLVLMQTRGLGSTDPAGTREIQRLRREAFTLAAWSCREIDRITAERDEARRLYCKAVEEIERGMSNDSARDVAKARDWDCFNNYTEEEVTDDGGSKF